MTDTAPTDTALLDTALDDRWATAPVPGTPAGWLERAREVSDILIVDAVDRDRANLAPHA